MKINKILNFSRNIKLASKDFGKPLGRKYFRCVMLSELTPLLYGSLIVLITNMEGPFPAGILMKSSQDHVIVKSPETGQILVIQREIVVGFTTILNLETDISNKNLQERPWEYVNEFIPLNNKS